MEQDQPAMKLKPFLFLALVTCGLAPAPLHADVTADNEKAVALIQKAGEPTTLAGLNAWYTAVPPQSNAATIYAEAFALLPDNASNTLPPLAQSRNVLDLLHQAAAMPQCRYPLDFNQGFATLLPHLPKIKLAAELLQQEAIQNAAQGRMDLAEQSVLAGLALGRSLENEPCIISQRLRSAVIELTIDGLEQTLWHKSYSETQLARLQSAFLAAETNDASAYAHALIGWRCSGLALFQLPPDKLGPSIEGIFKIHPDPASEQAAESYAKSPARDTDLAFYLRQMAGIIDLSQAGFPSALDKVTAWGNDLATVDDTNYPISKIFLTSIATEKSATGFAVPSLAIIPEKSAIGLAEMRVVSTVLAVERFRLAHQNSLPHTLADIPSDLLSAVPSDPFDGAPLRFKLIPQRGYMVYSIGPDRHDDGGIHKPQEARAGMSYDLALTVLSPIAAH